MAEPQPLAVALSELITRRGLARVRGESQLAEVWAKCIDGQWQDRTRVIGIRRGVLQVAVANAPLRSELQAFHKAAILATLQQTAPQLRIRDIKFQLKGDLSQSN